MAELVIPHVASWTSEAEEYVAIDPRLGRKAVFTRGRQGEGEPILGQLDPERQRDVVLRWLCQVCARPLGRLAFMVMDRNIQVQSKTEEYWGALEPAACFKCFCYAATHCPGLNRQRWPVLGVTGPEMVLMALVKPRGELAKNPDAYGAVSYLKVVPRIAWTKPWAEFLQEVKHG